MSNAQLKNVLDKMDAQALVMFIMNELNVEDFSGYPEGFSQLQQEFETSQNTFLPSMADPSQVPALLSTYTRVTVDPENLSTLQLAAGTKTLFLVYMGDKPAADRQTTLQQTDAIIARVLAQVKTLTAHYSAVLTGKHTTMGGEAVRRVSRSLKAAPEDSSNFFNMSCVYIYTSAAPILRFPPKTDQDSAVLVYLNRSLANPNPAQCNDTRQNASITWTNVKGPDGYNLTEVTLTYQFVGRLSGRDKDPNPSSWTLGDVLLAYKGTVDNKQVDLELQMDFDEVYAPKAFSYHCTSRKWAVKGNSTTPEEGAVSSLDMPGLQIQPFLGDKATAFGRAWDCTPFFTIPIWSGLFLSLILLLIFIWSMYMLASVPTMDRFDDPRGQPLHVPTSD